MDGNAPMRAADVSLAAAVAGALGWLPAVVTVIAGLLACVWYGLDIYDKLQRRKAAMAPPQAAPLPPPPLLTQVIEQTKEPPHAETH